MKNKKTSLILGVASILVLVGLFAINRSSNSNNLLDNSHATLVKTASAQELYLMFECPCCGKNIGECTCPMAGERRSFVDGLTVSGISEDISITAYVKKYGLESFIDKNKKEQFKEKLTQEAPADRPIISVNPNTYDLGDVSQKEGIVTTFFEIKNEGKGDLIIDKLETSCGCTSAAIVYQGKEGPKFAMPGHGINENIGAWQVIISAGDTAELKVYYDPNVHPDFRGDVIREIYVFSNDPIEFQKKVSIELNQVE